MLEDFCGDSQLDLLFFVLSCSVVIIYSILISSPHKRSPFVSIKLLSTTAKYISNIYNIQFDGMGSLRGSRV